MGLGVHCESYLRQHLLVYSKPETAEHLLSRIDRSLARDDVIAAILERRDLRLTTGTGAPSSSSGSEAQNCEHNAVTANRDGGELDDSESTVQGMQDSLYTPLQIVVDTARDLQSHRGTALHTLDRNVPLDQRVDHDAPFRNVSRLRGNTSTYLADEGLLNYFGTI